ncbi:asparagine synthase-related protein [Alphaproteobacteria bacterium]|nr:asparagine synthase-related protein [Alphaproteobacteria bacterium]
MYRKKHGFAMNTGILIKDTFNQKIKDTINNKDNIFYEYLNNKSINQIIEDHDRGNNDHKKKIWSIFSLMSFAENLNV